LQSLGLAAAGSKDTEFFMARFAQAQTVAPMSQCLRRLVLSVLIYHCYNEFTDELADRHVPERRLKRELPDHVLSER
jgi:hypothetical protein